MKSTSLNNLETSHVSPRKLPFKVFSVKFTCVQQFLTLTNVFHTQIITSGIHLLEGEHSVSEEMEIVFYRAIVLWNDEISDEKFSPCVRFIVKSTFLKDPKHHM